MSDKTPAVRQAFRFSDTVLINYEVHGHGPLPIVFLHGFAAALTTWHDIIPFFPAAESTLYLLDLKGFGFSSKPRDGRYSVEEQRSVVIAFLHDRGLSGVVLVGHSLGGGIALLASLEAERAGEHHLIARLILIAAAAYPQPLPPIMRLLRNRLLGRCILHLLPLRFMVRYTLHQIIANPGVITEARIVNYMNCFGRKGAASVFIQTCRQLMPERYRDIFPLYRTLRLPVLVIWGREDRVVFPSFGERLHRDIPGSKLVVLPRCGHIPHEEQPKETYAAIRNFLHL